MRQEEVSCRPQSRERRALEAAAIEPPRAKRRLLVLDRDALVQVGTRGADVQPVYEWLLAAPGEV